MKKDRIVSVVGLGYVGLPVAMAFGKKYRTIGFDIKPDRIRELKEGYDCTGEIESTELQAVDLVYTDRIEDLRQADFHIITVPTPVDRMNRPDLNLVFRASKMVGKALKKGDIVVYESTVYPGVTEEECVPILERVSGLTCGSDFNVGYSPERVNPGDRERVFTKITKVVAGQNEETLDTIASIYESVVTAGVYRAASIKTAEAAKVIENTQRDLNIALMNELAIIFHLMGIDTGAVLEAASTKWNFLKFRPGLVGGHCIGVDPYYLTHKAEQLGYIPEVIIAGRRINDNMGKFVAQHTVKEMIHAGHRILNSIVTVFGLTFKENCRDLRNSKVIDIIRELQDYGLRVQVHDPMALESEADREYGIRLLSLERLEPAAAIVVAVAHDAYRKMPVEQWNRLTGENPVLIDVKGIFDVRQFRSAGYRIWRL